MQFSWCWFCLLYTSTNYYNYNNYYDTKKEDEDHSNDKNFTTTEDWQLRHE